MPPSGLLVLRACFGAEVSVGCPSPLGMPSYNKRNNIDSVAFEQNMFESVYLYSRKSKHQQQMSLMFSFFPRNRGCFPVLGNTLQGAEGWGRFSAPSEPCLSAELAFQASCVPGSECQGLPSSPQTFPSGVVRPLWCGSYRLREGESWPGLHSSWAGAQVTLNSWPTIFPASLLLKEKLCFEEC